MCEGGGEEARHFRGFGDIGLDGDGAAAAAEGVDVGDDVLGGAGGICIVDDDGSAPGGQVEGDGGAEAAPRASYEGNFAAEGREGPFVVGPLVEEICPFVTADMV